MAHGKRLVKKTIPLTKYNITHKRQRDHRHCLSDCSLIQTRSLFLSPPGSLAITRQLKAIKSLQQLNTDWTKSKPLLRYSVSSAADKGISLLQIFGDGWLGLEDTLPSPPSDSRALCGPTWRPLGSRLALLHAPSWVMQQIADSGEACSGDARRQPRM